MKTLLGATAALGLLAGASSAHAARDYVWAAGSSTVFPFSTRTAENFAKKTGKKAPKVESLGTGGGIKMFCGGMGEKFPDIANASRPMKKSEFEACKAKGVNNIVELKVGFDGIVVAMDKSAPDYSFKVEHLYLGLGQTVLRGGQFVANPYKTWKDVGAGLPANRILVYGPPPTSGTRDAFVELAIEAGAKKFPTAKALAEKDEKGFKAKVDPLRTDGVLGRRRRERQRHHRHHREDPGRPGRVRLQLPRGERQPHQGRQRQRREAHGPDDRQRPIPAVALALHLRQEGPGRRDPGPEGVHRRVRVRLRDRPGRLPAGPRPDPPAPRPARGHEGRRRQAAADGVGPPKS
jgi:hypothetical protein